MSWIRIEKPRQIIGYDEDNKPIAVLDTQVGTAADLPDAGDEVDGYIVAAGSIAQIVEADEPTFVTLSGDSGSWYPEHSDTSASTLSAPNLNQNLAQLDLDKPSLGGGKSVLVDEPEQTEPEQTEPYEESIEEPEREVTDDERELL